MRLLGTVALGLTVFGVAAVYGASSIMAVRQGGTGSEFALRQLLGGLVGAAALLVVARVDYRIWQRYAWPLIGVALVSLVVPLLPFLGSVAPELNGARRWINLGIFTFQPSEAAKFAVIAWTAMLATKKGARVRTFRLGILPFVVILAPIAALILLEPDLSTALLLLLVAGTIIFAAGARIGHFFLLGLMAVPILWGGIANALYRLRRVLTFLSPGEDLDSSWQISQSLTGIGSGRLLGVGFGEGMQKLGYLPHAYSDFIFSTIGEEWGFVGATVLLVLFTLFVTLGLRIARSAPDRFGMLLALGLTTMIGVTVILHIAVTLALVPTTGLPLPFISYGRSNLVISLFATGVIMNVGARREIRRARK